MTHRYYGNVPAQAGQFTLEGAEAHHLIHVMRRQQGDRIVLFDGRGYELDARIERLTRREAELSILERRAVDRELPVRITLAAALPKGDRQRWMVEKAVELGVARLVPLQCTRSVVAAESKTLDRLRRTVIEASKQCGRNRLMEIADATSFSDLVISVPAAAIRLVAHRAHDSQDLHDSQDSQDSHESHESVASEPGCLPGEATSNSEPGCLPGEATSNSENARRIATASEVTIAVGPEGGFTDSEISAGRTAGWSRIDLGPRILRTETAAMLLTAMVIVEGAP
jgi:16S rRNA (uracil1498-N3)-methyltransferase